MAAKETAKKPTTTKSKTATKPATKTAVKKTEAAKTTASKTAKKPAAKATQSKTTTKPAPKSAPKAANKDVLHFEVLIVGGGAGGISTAASIMSRKSDLKIAIIEPNDKHYYQPGWTLVGGGVFEAEQTVHDEKGLIPLGVEWIQKAVTSFKPKDNKVVLDDGSEVSYDRMVVCPGLQLDWGKVKGLEDALGKDGVTSNYRYDLAPYTWELVKKTKSGKAIFTQPPMPIKCAGAPQKAMYLSCSEWLDQGVLKDIQVDFCNAGGVLFGVPDYVPALMDYVDKYDINLDFFYNLVEIKADKKQAVFEVKGPDDAKAKKVTMDYDMIHVCPPQSAPDFIKKSPLADDAGWMAVDPNTLKSTKFDNIWGLGDGTNTPNAKTAAAARKQAPVVAQNLVDDINASSPTASYDGYGSCPLTVERGKIVLAEFGYGGVLLPSFPKWMLDGTKPTRRAWVLKERVLPQIYWKAMLKGREWLAGPEALKSKDNT